MTLKNRQEYFFFFVQIEGCLFHYSQIHSICHTFLIFFARSSTFGVTGNAREPLSPWEPLCTSEDDSAQSLTLILPVFSNLTIFHMRLNTYLFFSILLALGSCVGTDFVDEPLGPVPTQLALSHTSLVLLEGESQQLSAQVFASDGSTLEASVNWSSRNSAVATVEADGLLTAVSEGQVWVDVFTQTLEDSILVTVSIDSEALAAITITTSPTNLAIGDTLQLEVELSNTNGMLLTDKEVTWSSTDPDICSVDDNGLVMALANGTTQIVASAEGVSSLPISLMVGADKLSRSGTFRGLNGYSVEGTATLERSADESMLVFGSDFRSQSGPGLFVYISPNATNVTGGVSLGELKTQSGTQSYPIPANVDPDEFDHVLIYCQPFRVPFGTANFE